MSLDSFMIKLRDSADKAASAMAETLADTIVRGFGRDHGGIPSTPGNYPNSQTGFLRNSIQWIPSYNQTAYVGSNAPYALYLQRGAHIRPRNAKALAIPLTKAAKDKVEEAGTPRAAIQEFKADTSNPVVSIKTVSGTIIARKRGRGKAKGEVEPLFLITMEAVIHPRPWATLGIRDARKDMLAIALRTMREGMVAA